MRPAPSAAALFDRVEAFLSRFIAYPSENERVAHVLWIAHTHRMDAWESTPRLAFLSPEPGSGKTRALEITELLVPRPVESVNVTSAYLFRKIGEDPANLPTILFDEIDTVFGPRAKENEEIRGVLNAGHRRGATAGRCVVRRDAVVTQELPAYCAVALAGIGGLPDTILSRSIIVRMRRRLPTETVEPYRRRVHKPDGQDLRDELAAWAEALQEDAIRNIPAMPEGIVDRDADVWEPLLTCADIAGGRWSARARRSAVALVALPRQKGRSLGVRLLSDLRVVFDGTDARTTEEILESLCGMEEAPWGDLNGKPLDSRSLSRLLRPYEVRPRDLRVNEGVRKGYLRTDLLDSWERYVSVADNEDDSYRTSARTKGTKTEGAFSLSAVSATSATSATPQVEASRIAVGGR